MLSFWATLDLSCIVKVGILLSHLFKCRTSVSFSFCKTLLWFHCWAIIVLEDALSLICTNQMLRS